MTILDFHFGGGDAFGMQIHPKEPTRLSLAQLPTPLIELGNLSRRLGLPRLLMKRDDLTGLETTGNKIRKLEYVLAEALAQGADTIVTHGGHQSNHCRATAAACARLGLRVRLLLRAADERPANDGNLFLDRLFGADVSLHPVAEYNGRRAALFEEAMEGERKAGRRPYFVPVGASVPLGTWGYVRCMGELVEQLGREAVVNVFVPAGSSGTVAGAILGKALLGCSRWRVLGVPISDSVEFFAKDVRELIDKTIDAFDLCLTRADTPVELIGGYIGEGYAIPYPQAVETLKVLARNEGIALDPVYTAKAFTGFLETVRAMPASEAHSVFIHTGGIFGLMARRDLFGCDRISGQLE